MKLFQFNSRSVVISQLLILIVNGIIIEKNIQLERKSS